MPLSKVGLVRTDGQANAPKGKDPYIPLYSVLFWYGKDINFVNTASGTLDYDYYRKYTEVCYPSAIYYNPDGSINPLQSSPIIASIGVDNGWNTNTGLCMAATTSIPNTAATLFETHTHNPTTLGRTIIYKALGYFTGDTRSTTSSYIEQKGDYTHKHNANNIANALRSISYGESPPATIISTGGTGGGGLVSLVGEKQGLQSISVTPILRDPRLTTTGTGYNDTKLTFLPKDVIVFGNNLPTQYFTQTDNTHSLFVAATNKVLPLIAQENNYGVINKSGSVVSFTVSSNTVLNHNHNVFPVVRTYKSNKTQTAYKVVEAGVHSHQVTYTANVELRSKILKAWITKSANTPIANGVIIGYSIGKNTLYQGLSANSKGLPFGWCFCDGTNGTPDLRGYYIYANFDSANTYHNIVYKSSNTLTISKISMAANGNHSHLGPLTAQETGIGAAVDIGSHTSEINLDHTHSISTANTFDNNIVNVKVGQSYSYTPPTVQFAFIMYNNTIT
jgi:hypothetical protein